MLQTYFNQIVATRHKTQESLNTVIEAKRMWDEAGDDETKKAEAVNKLINLKFVTIMKDQFDGIEYTYHSRKPITGKLEVLDSIIKEYNKLDANNKATKIETLLSEKLTDYVLGSASRPIREMGKLLGLEDDFVKKY